MGILPAGETITSWRAHLQCFGLETGNKIFQGNGLVGQAENQDSQMLKVMQQKVKTIKNDAQQESCFLLNSR